MFCNNLLVLLHDGFNKLNLRHAESIVLYQFHRKNGELCFVSIF